ncbi:MAG: aldo/keto reductase [Theionarchaea archaeon]|nr:aldo/keto reductase [Theionarchaea archaeon]
MEYRQIGNTGLDVSVIGLGTEYLNRQSQETVTSVVHTAIERGVNLIDILFTFDGYLETLGNALEGYRENVILQVHIGSGEYKGQYKKTRSVTQCKTLLEKSLSVLNISSIDIANIHFVNTVKQYDHLLESGVVEFAHELKDEGLARLVGMSTHSVSAAVDAVKRGIVDVIMIQINLANNALLGRNDMLAACVHAGVGVLAMKPFAGGKLLQRNKKVRIGKYQTGGLSMTKKMSPSITPVQCISYVLSQVGVSSAMTGVKNTDELKAALAYEEAGDQEKDFSGLLEDFQEYVTGECVYCNHCLPCPSSIDIGQTIRLLDTAQQGLTPEIKELYENLEARASDCTECGSCVERCPFDVAVTEKMKEATQLFEKSSR